MIEVPTVLERHPKTGVGDCIHLREKPLRIERSLGPAMAPAWRRNGRPAAFRAFSSSSRTMRPFGKPASRAVWSSHFARSSGSRTVIVLLICSKCNPNHVRVNVRMVIPRVLVRNTGIVRSLILSNLGTDLSARSHPSPSAISPSLLSSSPGRPASARSGRSSHPDPG